MSIPTPLPGSSAAMARPTVLLEDQLCFNLYTSSLAVLQVYKPLLERLGLTYPQYLVMTALWEREGQTLKQLAERLHQDSGSLTPLIKRLEVAGYLTRKRDERDERNLCIRLTTAGRALQVQGQQVCDQFAATCGLEREQADMVRDTLKLLETKLRSGQGPTCE